jgi:ribosomal protein S27AE
MTKYVFKLVCPRCGKLSCIGAFDPEPPRVNCGDCLMNDIEVVQLDVAKTFRERVR